ncbi:MAG: hypothetical protein ACOVLB_09125 [Candidatus Nanopelagicus sp.]
MAKRSTCGKKYFHALGQSARARGLNKLQAEELHRIDVAPPFARIAFDAGFRGFSL